MKMSSMSAQLEFTSTSSEVNPLNIYMILNPSTAYLTLPEFGVKIQVTLYITRIG